MSYHDAVGFSNGPQVDFFVIPTGHEDSSGLVTQGYAVDTRAMSHEFLCKVMLSNREIIVCICMHIFCVKRQQQSVAYSILKFKHS